MWIEKRSRMVRDMKINKQNEIMMEKPLVKDEKRPDKMTEWKRKVF